MTRRWATLALASAAVGLAQGEEAKTAKSYSGAELIAAVKAAKPKGDIQIRATLKKKSEALMQIQILRHSTDGDGDMHLYQVLYPKERKGEGLLLHVTKSGFTGWSCKAGGKPVALTPGDRKLPLFGTDVLVEDLLADFINWPQHNIVRTEKLGAAGCSVVESAPGGGKQGEVKMVRSWIENERLYPKKIELIGAAGSPLRLVETQRIIRASSGYYVPVEFSVTTVATGSRTEVTGRGLRDDLTFTEADFSAEALARGLERQDDK